MYPHTIQNCRLIIAALFWQFCILKPILGRKLSVRKNRPQNDSKEDDMYFLNQLSQNQTSLLML